MHSFSVDSVNITVLWLTNPDVNLKRMHQLYNSARSFNLFVDEPGLHVKCNFAEVSFRVVCDCDSELDFARYIEKLNPLALCISRVVNLGTTTKLC